MKEEKMADKQPENGNNGSDGKESSLLTKTFQGAGDNIVDGFSRLFSGAGKYFEAAKDKATGADVTGKTMGAFGRAESGAARVVGIAGGLVAAPLRGAGYMLEKHKIMSTIAIFWIGKKVFNWFSARRQAKAEAEELQRVHAIEAEQERKLAALSQAHGGVHGAGYINPNARPPAGYDSWDSYLGSSQSGDVAHARGGK